MVFSYSQHPTRNFISGYLRNNTPELHECSFDSLVLAENVEVSKSFLAPTCDFFLGRCIEVIILRIEIRDNIYFQKKNY